MKDVPQEIKWAGDSLKMKPDTSSSSTFKVPKERIDNLDKRIDGIEAKINEVNFRTIELLAFFVAIFTFISVDIQVFKYVISWLAAAGFTLIMLGGLFLFLIILSKLILERETTKGTIILGISSACFIVIGILCIDYANNDYLKMLDDRYVKSDKISEIISNSSTPYLSFKKCILSGLNTWQCVNLTK